MCWCFPFARPPARKPRHAPPPEKKKRRDSLHGNGVAVADPQEKRRTAEPARKRRSEGDTATLRSPRREERPRQQQYHVQQPQHPQHPQHPQQPQHYQYQYHQAYRNPDYARPPLNVQVPSMWHRGVDADSTSSQETLLNPRPHRSPHQRQAHPKRTSQTTLRGRGAKRDPPRPSKSKKSSRDTTRGWSLFAPSPPKTPARRDHAYQALDTAPRHRSSRSDDQQRHQRARPSQRQTPSARSTRSRTPNTAARRVPDRRFAVLAATNQALEDLRREAFAQPSPPPRRERLQRYQGVAIPTSTIPFNWDCLSSSQASAARTETAPRSRRSRR